MSDAFPSALPGDQNPIPGNSPHAVPLVRPSWIDIFLGTLVSPGQTFRTLCELELSQHNFAGAFFAVCLVSLMEGFRQVQARHPEYAAISIPVAIFLGLITWLSISGAIGLAGQAFGQPRHKLGAIISTMGWSFLPWIFMGPVACLHNAFGHATALFAIIPAIWVYGLQLTAITQTYNLKLWQTLCLAVVVPLLIWIAQLCQLVETMTAIFSVA